MPDERLPQRIGRYEIVGRLASGGMAEVFLGRLSGPHGFERPVVVKRILPHLAGNEDIVAMFLDEARIIANLRHPNLIHVHELGREGDDLFIAMEFLEGESLSGLCRRLAKQGELLDPNLAAHIVSEACSGLHAAHECASADGRPLEIVHRDVSPQNIFLTYAGAVHVIDFGIATTVDRVGRTEAGTVRGKLEYISPEQLQAVPLDRRADLFGLGVVLFELITGRRAYKRGSPAQTMMAVLSDSVPKLAALRPDAPAALQAICSRALAKNRNERFDSAAELRRELLAFVRKNAEGDLGEQLAALMRRLFVDRIAEKTDMLRQVRQGSDVPSLPAAEVDIHVELATAEQQPTMGLTALSQSISVPNPRRSPVQKWAAPIAALATATAIAIAGVTLGRSGDRARTSAAGAPINSGAPATLPELSTVASASNALPPSAASTPTAVGSAVSTDATTPATTRSPVPAMRRLPPSRLSTNPTNGKPKPSIW